MTPLTWDEIESRTRDHGESIPVIADGNEAVITPRLNDPGFYVMSRSLDPERFWSWRSKSTLATFRRMVDDGRVFADSASGVVS